MYLVWNDGKTCLFFALTEGLLLGVVKRCCSQQEGHDTLCMLLLSKVNINKVKYLEICGEIFHRKRKNINRLSKWHRKHDQGQCSQFSPVEIFRLACLSLLLKALTTLLRHALTNLTKIQFSSPCPSREEECKQVKRTSQVSTGIILKQKGTTKIHFDFR